MSIVKLRTIRQDPVALCNEIDWADTTRRKKVIFAISTMVFAHIGATKILNAVFMSRENEHCDFFPISPTERSTMCEQRRILTGIGCAKLILSYNSILSG